ncbi:hypothetical protein LTR36_008958 [Oleoguttula mirabilis]|uniref:Uncharacterized protein n=1 Tax=Oleoguttula mirabilis TaxID=1507867 RepID=A0AAV9J6Z7_9PEZI|nr:hypothetical protein LTR36_008958 [Oleoguttula mirabilis]
MPIQTYSSRRWAMAGLKTPRPHYEAMKVLDSRGIPYEKTWSIRKLRPMVQRSDRGLLALTKCTRSELLQFCYQRAADMKWVISDPALYTTDNLIMMLVMADNECRFPRFMDLPPELRVNVYRHALLHHEERKPSAVQVGDIRTYKKTLATLAVTQTNSLIRREALPVYYSNNNFSFDLTYSRPATEQWLQLIGQDAVQHIRCISRRDPCHHDDDDSGGDDDLPNAVTLAIDLGGATTEVRYELEGSCKACAEEKEKVWAVKMLHAVEQVVKREAGVPQVSAGVILALLDVTVDDRED